VRSFEWRSGRAWPARKHRPFSLWFDTSLVEVGGESVGAGVFEDHSGGDLDLLGFVDQVGQAQREQRVPAVVEEVVVGPDGGFQDVGEQAAELFLAGRPGGTSDGPVG
jgi:hypothetical protein